MEHTNYNNMNIAPKKLYIIIFLLTCCCFPATFAATEADTTQDLPVIDSIEIRNENIYDTSLPEYDHWIFSLANRLHIPTRKSVIARELLLHKGDSYNTELAEETARNLRSYIYIWDAEARLITTDSGTNILRVRTVDRWSLVGGPSIERISGQMTYRLGLRETNFIGLGQTLAFDYVFRDYDEDFYVASFFDRRLFGKNLALNLHANDDPEVGIKTFTLSRPYYSLGSRYSFEFDLADYDRRNDYYQDGYLIGRDYFEGSKVSLQGGCRFGSYHTKLVLDLTYTYTDFSISDTIRYYDNVTVNFANDSLYHLVEPRAGLKNIKYIRTNRIDLFTRDEDIELVTGILFSAGRAWDPRSGKQLYDVVGYEGNYSAYYGSNLILAYMAVKRWFHEERLLRKVYNISISYFNNRLCWYTLALVLKHDRDIRTDGVHGLYLGENNGIRGYPRNYSNGEKYFLLNVENRFFPNINVWASRISPVQFVDLGSTWNRGEDFDVGDLDWSVGVGLRISTERLANREAVRIDLAYAGRIKKWQISFGLGQFLN